MSCGGRGGRCCCRYASKEAGAQLVVMKRTRATRLVLDDSGAVSGLEWRHTQTHESGAIHTKNVVIATGGYSNDHSEDSLLAR